MGLTLRNLQCVKRIPDTAIVIPAAFDWRIQQPNCTLPIRDQGQCGACWAFATVRPLAYRRCIFNPNQTDASVYSPQYLLNCDHGCFPSDPTICEGGCSGGYLDLAWDFLKATGTVLETEWPFTDSDNAACPSSVLPTLQAIDRYTVQSVPSIQREILQFGPVTAGLVAYTDLLQYDGTTVYIKQSSAGVIGGHAVTLIGWGTQAGVDYWWAENQWGTAWGNAGYLKIRRGTNEVGIEQYIHAGRPNITGVVFTAIPDIGPPSPGGEVVISFAYQLRLCPLWLTLFLLLN